MVRPDGFVFLAVDETSDKTKRISLSFQRRANATHGQIRARGWLASDDVVINIPASGWFALPDVSLVDVYAVGLVTGGRRKRLACAGAKVGDRLSVFPKAEPPAGYVIGDAVCTEAGWIRVGFTGPALAVGVSHTIALQVAALR